MSTPEGVFPKVGNDPFFNSEVNDFRDNGRILQIYTDVGFDTSQNNTGTNADNHELNDMTDVSNGTYVKIEITVKTVMNASGGASSSTLQIQTKDIGGVYSDTFTKITVWSDDPDNATATSAQVFTLIHYHTLTAEEKTNGIKIKILGESIREGSGTTSQSNINTTVTLFT